MKRRDAVLESLKEQALWQRANVCMMEASTPWAFVGK